ncbi:hypothetical protein GUJ93_ZPchr0003g18403 [Zizania palustris]|uniref:Uncharacterized protein n=1 Tax=Zizania palustris TaxID=103762 RepID=A0A8J5SXB1_ZIZPA|nr:hypothetical protein GUJ93_ZPchr0003g18403 [Zizania palustris]
MGRAPCCEKVGLKRGRWTAEEDEMLAGYIAKHGEGSWRSLPKNAGLLRCGKSCRLRWINYLRAGVKRGNIARDEEDVIIKLHATLGNRWSLIASHLPGRTDNEIKNYWNSHLSRQIHTYRRTYSVPSDAAVTIDVSKLQAAEKRRGGRTAGQSRKGGDMKRAEDGPPGKVAEGGCAHSPAATADTPAPESSPARAQSDEARSGSVVVDPELSSPQPNNSSGGSNSNSNSTDGPCSEVTIGPMAALDPIEIGLWEAESEMEALLCGGFASDGLDPVDVAANTDDFLDMDWDGLATELWGEPSNIGPSSETGCNRDELESFESWLLSDSC